MTATALLDTIVARVSARPKVRLWLVLGLARAQGTYFLLLLFAFIAIIPIPGPNMVMAVPLMLLGLAMLRHQDGRLRLPKPLLRAGFAGAHLATAYSHLRPALLWLENHMRHNRFPLMLGLIPAPVAGLFAMYMALLIALPIPIPGTNSLPAFGVILLALGLLHRDGAALALSFAIGATFTLILLGAVLLLGHLL
jgi:hypothetical protein